MVARIVYACTNNILIYLPIYNNILYYIVFYFFKYDNLENTFTYYIIFCPCRVCPLYRYHNIIRKYKKQDLTIMLYGVW